MTAAMGEAVLPCVGNAALYDIVLFGEGTPAERQQALHRAAALCGSCPARCDQMVTVDSGPADLVLLEPGWMPPAREGRAEPQPRMPVRKRDAHPDVQVGVDYVAPGERVAVWAAMAAERVAAGHSFGAIATDLCVPVDAVARLVEMGRQGVAA